jgi:hypothetical protein
MPGRRRTLQSTRQQRGRFLVGDGARTAWPQFIVEPLYAMFDGQLPPFTQPRLRPIQAFGDFRIRKPFNRPQHQCARVTSACGRLREAANPPSSSRSAALSSTPGLGLPIDICKDMPHLHEDTRRKGQRREHLSGACRHPGPSQATPRANGRALPGVRGQLSDPQRKPGPKAVRSFTCCM